MISDDAKTQVNPADYLILTLSNDSIVILGECCAARILALEACISITNNRFLAQPLNEASEKDFRHLAQKIVNFLPRLDVEGFGFPIELVNTDTLVSLIIGTDSAIAKLHHVENKKTEVDLKKYGAPLPSSGHLLVDLLTQLSRMFSANDAIALTEKFGLRFLNQYIPHFIEACRDPEERMHEYINKMWEEQKKLDPIGTSAVTAMSTADLSKGIGDRPIVRADGVYHK